MNLSMLNLLLPFTFHTALCAGYRMGWDSSVHLNVGKTCIK